MIIKVRRLLRKGPVQLAILFTTLALFLGANALLGANPDLNFIPPLIAVLVVIEIFTIVGLEIKDGTKRYGWEHEALDTLIALLVAVAVWYGAAFMLNTDSPVSGVVSCSMLPNLQRGDFIIVQGAPIDAYEIEMTKQELESLTGRATVYYNGKNVSLDGSIFSYCLVNPSSDVCRAFVETPENIVEKKGVFTYNYDTCLMESPDQETTPFPCLKSITFRNREYLTNFSDDIIVYAPPPGYLYSLIGDIVHRVFFKINVDGDTYYITRGDNNPITDLQVYSYNRGLTNPPIPENYVRGKVIARIPIIGYFKLFLSGYLQEDPQCRTQLSFEHV